MFWAAFSTSRNTTTKSNVTTSKTLTTAIAREKPSLTTCRSTSGDTIEATKTAKTNGTMIARVYERLKAMATTASITNDPVISQFCCSRRLSLMS